MIKETAIKLFEQKQIRSVWSEEEEKWYFSIVDVIEVLTGSPRSRKYWNALKTKLKEEGSELSQKLGQLKMQSSEGKFYKTDVADTEQLFRLIQSIPSPKAELNMLAEATTTEISKEKKPETFEQNRKIAKQGGTIAGNTRKEIEEKTGKSVITRKNAKALKGKNKEIEG